MNGLVCVNSHNLSIKEIKRQRVVTLRDIDELHERPNGTASRNFRKNKIRFIENEDYFRLCGDEAIEFATTNFVGTNTSKIRELILITESGYLMLVKSFNDDKAWNVQRQLVKTYFRAKEFIKQQQSDPQWQEARHQNKAVRLQETDEVKKYIAYCEESGSKNAKNYYTTITKLVNNAVGISKEQRDKATYETLQLISLLENTVRHTIAEELQRQTEYHKIYYVCKEKVSGIMSLIYLPEHKLLPTG